MKGLPSEIFKRDIKKTVMTGEHFKKEEILSSLNTFERLNKNRRYLMNLASRRYWQDFKKQFQ